MRGSGITIRPAGLDDLERIASWNEALALESEGLRLEPRVVRDGLRALLEDAGKGFYSVAEVDGVPAGTLLITYEWSDWRNGPFYWIQSVYIEPAHRRCGVFTALFRHVERLAAERGVVGLRLYVHAGNTLAQEVYRRLGLVHHDYFVLETPDRLRAGGEAH
jgi:GNAT superfamily N-acetyltransferase